MTTQYAMRKFQFWLFRVGHGELLVRSPRDEVVSATSLDDVRRAEERLGRPVDRSTIRVLETEGRRHLVVAAYFNIEENDLDLGEVPFD